MTTPSREERERRVFAAGASYALLRPLGYNELFVPLAIRKSVLFRPSVLFPLLAGDTKKATRRAMSQLEREGWFDAVEDVEVKRASSPGCDDVARAYAALVEDGPLAALYYRAAEAVLDHDHRSVEALLKAIGEALPMFGHAGVGPSQARKWLTERGLIFKGITLAVLKARLRDRIALVRPVLQRVAVDVAA